MRMAAAAVSEDMKRHAELEAVLQTWWEEGMVLPSWSISWESGASTWMARFRMAGSHTWHTLSEAEFALYLAGWRERSVAILHRRLPAEEPKTRKAVRPRG